MKALYDAFQGTDATLAEINPLILTKSGELAALDAKMNFDDNALYRHPDLVELRDIHEEEPLEVEASKHSLNYIKLDGNVGCMVNGAGLAMATMDIIKLAGGEPANFLDVGGGASTQQVENAFGILLSDSSVQAVLINIFGGIVRCDRVASGVVEAVKKRVVKVPIVVRLEGTNSKEGGEILEKSGLNFTVAGGMQDAATKVVAAVGGRAS
jgi:succinyl-CoA synthetase beta subunit